MKGSQRAYLKNKSMCSVHFNSLKTVFLDGITALLQMYNETVPAKILYQRFSARIYEDSESALKYSVISNVRLSSFYFWHIYWKY